MKLELNPRGNGACPLCKYNDNCTYQIALKDSLAKTNGQDSEMEIVVYSCPKFTEKA